jgi:8-hydroxy-5-deazaflavin:NADPH oxidoreductase
MRQQKNSTLRGAVQFSGQLLVALRTSAELLPTESRKGRKVQVFIAGDDETAKAKVSGLVKVVGFEPVDSGTLYNCRFLEPMGEMNILLGFFLGWGTSGAPEYRNS